MKTRLAAAILVVGGVAVLVLFMWATNSEELVAEGPFEAVEIETDGGDVRVTGTEATGVVVRRESSRAARVAERRTGGVMRLSTDCPAVALLGCRIAYDLEVPSGARVSVATRGGAVRIGGNLHGPVRIDAGAGDVTLDGLAGALTTRTTSGAVTARGLRSETIDIATSGGSVSVAVADRPPEVLLVETASGAIEAVLPDAAYRVAAESGGPVDVAVSVDATSPLVVSARSQDGAVRIRSAAPALPQPGRTPS